MNDKKQLDFLSPALIAGGIAGFVSAFPFLNLINCLCCLWIIFAAVLASYLLKKNSAIPLAAGDGALVGALTGVVAAVVQSFVSLPFRGLNLTISRRFLERMSQFTEDFPSGWEELLSRAGGPTTLPFFILGLFFTAAIFAVFGALGGVIGVSLFKSNRTSAGTSSKI